MSDSRVNANQTELGATNENTEKTNGMLQSKESC